MRWIAPFGFAERRVGRGEGRRAVGEFGPPAIHFAGELGIAHAQHVEFELQGLEARRGHLALAGQPLAAFGRDRPSGLGLSVRHLRGRPAVASGFLSLFGAGHRGALREQFGIRGEDLRTGTVQCARAFAHLRGQRVTPARELRRLGDGVGQGPRRLLMRALDRKSTRLNSSHVSESRMPSSA